MVSHDVKGGSVSTNPEERREHNVKVLMAELQRAIDEDADLYVEEFGGCKKFVKDGFVYRKSNETIMFIVKIDNWAEQRPLRVMPKTQSGSLE